MMDASKAKRAFIIGAVVLVLFTSTLAFLFPYSTDPAAKVIWYKRVPGFVAMLGFFGCLVMVPLVKTIAKKLLQRPEEYYAPLESRLAAMTVAPPGTSLADPSAPSEANVPEDSKGALPEMTGNEAPSTSHDRGRCHG